MNTHKQIEILNEKVEEIMEKLANKGYKGSKRVIEDMYWRTVKDKDNPTNNELLELENLIMNKYKQVDILNEKVKEIMEKLTSKGYKGSRRVIEIMYWDTVKDRDNPTTDELLEIENQETRRLIEKQNKI